MKANKTSVAIQMLEEAQSVFERIENPSPEGIRRQRVLEETITQEQRARSQLRERIIAVG